MKKYIVRLTGEDRKCCEAKIGKLAGSSQQARRARILKQIDADGTNWAKQQVAAAFDCHVRTVETRRRCKVGGQPRHGNVLPVVRAVSGPCARGKHLESDIVM